MKMGEEMINIPPIMLKWSDWVSWDALIPDVRYGGGVRVPNHEPGVYEVRYRDSKECLTIGKASDLRMRIKQGLVKGKTKHSSGFRIRANEEVSKLVVRWSTTDRPAAAEEELHRNYRIKFGELPKYTEHT